MAESLFKWKHFESDIVLLCVRWYLKYPLFCRNLSDIMKGQGLSVSPTTIRRRVQEYSPIMCRIFKKHIRTGSRSTNKDARRGACGFRIYLPHYSQCLAQSQLSLSSPSSLDDLSIQIKRLPYKQTHQ